MEQKVVKGDRFTNYLGRVCVVKSIYKNNVVQNKYFDFSISKKDEN